MKVSSSSKSLAGLLEARRLMHEALLLLDELGEAGEAGSHLDLAICRLQQHLDLRIDLTAAEGTEPRSSQPAAPEAQDPGELIVQEVRRNRLQNRASL